MPAWDERGAHLARVNSDIYFILGIITSSHFAQHSVIHLTIYASLQEHAQWHGILYKIIIWSSTWVFFLIGVFWPLSLVMRMLRYSFILSAYLWLSLLISSLTHSILTSWCRVVYNFSFFYFILGIITNCHFAWHSVTHLTIYGNLKEEILKSICPMAYVL